MPPRNSFPGFWVLANSCIEIAEVQDLVVCRGVLQEPVHIWIELIFFYRICQEIWSVNAEKCEVLFFIQRETHGDDVVWVTGDSVSSSKAMEFLTMEPTPKKRLSADGLPDQYKVYPAPCSFRLPSRWEPDFAESGNFDVQSWQFVCDENWAASWTIAVGWVKQCLDAPACNWQTRVDLRLGVLCSVLLVFNLGYDFFYR